MFKFGFSPVIALTCVTAIYASAADRAAPSAVPPNASRVTASVLAQKVWPPGSLENVRPLVPSTQTLHSIDLKILSSEFAVPNLSHLASVGETLSVFSPEEIPADLVGKKIEASITLTGSTEGTRWMLQNFKHLP